MPPAYEVLLLNTAIPQIQAAQSGDTYVVPRDIAFSAALTLSAGTANGVPYLNGSKVVTTGSALTFDGTKFTQTASTTGILAEFKNSASNAQNGNIVAANDAGTALRVQVFGSAAGTAGMLSAGSPAIYTSATELNLVADNAAGVIKFASGGTAEKMRLDASGNLLVGATSSSSGITLERSGATSAEIKLNQTGAGGRDYRISSTGSGYGTAGQLIFYDVTASAERARITSGGDLQIANGNLVMSTSGKGIDFSATASGSGTMTSELLADYEEGTWTPTATSSAGTNGTLAYTSSGTYTKIGRQVTIRGEVAITDWGSRTGAFRVGGIPFTAASEFSTGSCILGNVTITGVQVNTEIGNAATTQISVAMTSSAGGFAYLQVSDFAVTANIWFEHTYFV